MKDELLFSHVVSVEPGSLYIHRDGEPTEMGYAVIAIGIGPRETDMAYLTTAMVWVGKDEALDWFTLYTRDEWEKKETAEAVAWKVASDKGEGIVDLPGVVSDLADVIHRRLDYLRDLKRIEDAQNAESRLAGGDLLASSMVELMDILKETKSKAGDKVA